MHNHHHDDMVVSDEDKATCPVMNVVISKKQAIDKGLTQTINGVDYYLCCRSCVDTLVKDTAKYTV